MYIKVSKTKTVNAATLSCVELGMLLNDLKGRLSEHKKQMAEIWTEKQKVIDDVSVFLSEKKEEEKQEKKAANVRRANNQDRLFRVAARKTLSEDDFYRVCLAAEGMERESMTGGQETKETST